MRQVFHEDYQKYLRFQQLSSIAHLGTINGKIIVEMTNIIRNSKEKFLKNSLTRKDYMQITNVIFSAAPSCFGVEPVELLNSHLKIQVS